MNYIFTCPNIFSFLVKAQVKDKNDVHVKKEGHKDEATTGKDNKDEIIPMDNTAKLSYRDVLVKGPIRQQYEQTMQELLYKAMEAISLLPMSESSYDLDNENYDDLPDMPQEELTEAQQNQLIWESSCEAFEGTEAGKYFIEAFKIKTMLQRGF